MNTTSNNTGAEDEATRWERRLAERKEILEELERMRPYLKPITREEFNRQVAEIFEQNRKAREERERGKQDTPDTAV